MKKNILNISEKVTKNISICHIYSKTNKLSFIDEYADNFLHYNIVNIENDSSITSKADIFVLEFEKINKDGYQSVSFKIFSKLWYKKYISY